MTDLRDNIGKTAKARFNAHRRLNNHNIKSMLVIILYSTVLLLTSIAELSGVEIKNSTTPPSTIDQLVGLIPISLSLVILIYSSIIFFANYSVRAEKFHQCGLELNNLARTYDISNDADTFDDLEVNNSYDNILKRYENHSYVDYLKDKPHKNFNYYSQIMYDNVSYMVLAVALVSYVVYFFKSILSC